MSRDPAPDVKLVAFWPAASGCGVESIAVRFGPSFPKPFVARLTSDAEPLLLGLAGYAGFALVSERPAEDPLGAPQQVRLSHLSRAPARAPGETRRS
jgi:hypothetical protein